MVIVETRYKCPPIRRDVGKRIEFVHRSSQLSMMQESTVSFPLHSIFKHRGETHLDIIGFADRIVIAYFDPNSYIVLGEYRSGVIDTNRREDIERANLENLSDRLISSTSAFLRSGRYPEECHRIYAFHLPASQNEIRVIAENRRGILDETITVRFLRRGKGFTRPIEVATLTRNPHSWQLAT